MTWILVQDQSAHWYLIPKSKEKDWNKWSNLPEDDERTWDVPKYAVCIGGSPSMVSFENPRINDTPVAWPKGVPT